MTAPPRDVIHAAIASAQESPCQKSKRGVAIYCTTPLAPTVYDDQYPLYEIVSCGWNAMPGGAPCDGGDRCRSLCGRRCVHAEVRAIRACLIRGSMSGCDAVHVKVDANDRLVAGGPPSCADCSKLVLDVGLDGFWLYELPPPYDPDAAKPVPPAWRRYTAVQFHALSLAANDLATLCPLCNGAAVHHNFGRDVGPCSRCDGRGYIP